MSRSQRYQLNKNKYLLPPELEALKSLLAVRIDRDALIIKLLLATGARASEMLAVTKASLDEHNQTIFINGLKGSDDREIPLAHDLYLELSEYAKHVQGETLFPFSLRRLEQIWHEMRPAAKKLHCLRHTFALELYKRSRDLRAVQVALGHRNIQNTMIYAEYEFKRDELRKILIPA